MSNRLEQVYALIDKYYSDNPALRNVLLVHSEEVAKKALKIVDRHPELNADRDFVEEAALLHDIGIVKTNAPSIFCFGNEPYIRHGIIGAEIVEREGLAQYARVCARHTGTGLPACEIIEQNLPLPHIDLVPETVEEQIICFADKFFSKTKLNQEKSVEQVKISLRKFGEDSVKRFEEWCKMFL